MNKCLIKLISVVLLMLLLCSCGKGKSDKSSSEKDSVLTESALLTENVYTAGEKMGDYVLVDIYGNTYKFSEILKEKKAIVLNFWFVNCGPCMIEFPYLEEAYQNYKDELEVLAINCVDGTKNDLEKFAADNKLTFPIISDDIIWQSAMKITGYPTTIVIDRYGVIAMKHSGYIDSTETFNKIFEFFTADDYKSTVVKDINDII